MRTVARLNVTPVKGLRLQHPDRVELTAEGVAENRRFCLLDEDGRLLSGDRHGPLVAVRARYDAVGERLALRFPDGEAVEGDTTATGEPVPLDLWGRPASARPLEGPFAEALTRYVGRPVRLVRFDRVGDGNDAYPVSILSTASVRELTRQADREETVDARRFRMLVEVDGCERPHEEDSWIGREVRMGEALVGVAETDTRCVVTTQDPDTGTKDLDTLRIVAGYRRIPGRRSIDFGVYADVVRPGAIEVGDPVEPV